MTNASKNERVGAIVAKSVWREAMTALREILRESRLTETVKWGQPCYTLNDRNVVLIHGFKDYCALLFMKGALMNDPERLLVQQTGNVQSGRQIRFAGLSEILDRRAVLKAYVENAIAVETSGLKVERKTTAEFPYPEELRARFEASADFKSAFAALTPGRQRGYLLHFSAAKQAKTRQARIDKCAPQILAGKGLDD